MSYGCPAVAESGEGGADGVHGDQRRRWILKGVEDDGCIVYEGIMWEKRKSEGH